MSYYDQRFVETQDALLRAQKEHPFENWPETLLQRQEQKAVENEVRKVLAGRTTL